MATTLGHLIFTLNSWGAAFCGVAGPMLIQSLAVTAVLLLLVWACSRTRAAFRYALLMLVLVKLLLPPSFSLPTGLGCWLSVPKRPPTLQRGYYGAVGGNLQANRPGTGPVTLSGDAFLFLSWIAGMAVLAVLIATRCRRVWRTGGIPASADLQHQLHLCQQEIGLKRSLPLELSSSCASPAVAGLLSPVILIPQRLADSLSRSQLRHVLLHELAHVKRGDLWVNHLQIALQVLHWYNPLLWLANALIRRVREEAVDQRVMAALGREAGSYPSTLVAVAKMAFSRSALNLGFIGIMESKAAFKRRVTRLVENSPENYKLGGLRTGVVIATAAFLLPMAHPQSSDSEKAPATPLLETRPVADRGSDNAGIAPLRLEFTQALQAHGMTYEQFRQKYAGERDLKPSELETLATKWLMAQTDGAKTNAPGVVARIVIKHIGPAAATDDQIKAIIGAKMGTPFTATQVDADVRGLYATGLFADVRVAQERTPEGTVLTYVVQERPRLAQIAIEGNTKIGDAALRQKLASRVGEPLDERKLFADAQTIQEAYERLGFSGAVVRYKISNDEKTGRSAVTFQITANDQGAVIPAPLLSLDGRQIVITNTDGSIKIWDLTTRTPGQRFVYSASFSPDGKLIAGTGDQVVKLREVPNTSQVVSTQAQKNGIWHVEFSPDGKRLVTVGTNQAIRLWDTNGTVRLWDAATGKEILAAPPGRQPIDIPGAGVSTQTGIMSDPQFRAPSIHGGIKSDPQFNDP